MLQVFVKIIFKYWESRLKDKWSKKQHLKKYLKKFKYLLPIFFLSFKNNLLTFLIVLIYFTKITTLKKFVIKNYFFVTLI